MTELANRSKVEIVSKGSYATLDNEGYIVNSLRRDDLQPHWLPVIDATLGFYKQNFGDSLHSFFVRGTVAKGEAVDFISDLDTFAYVHDLEEHGMDGVDEFLTGAKGAFPFCEGIELQPKPVSSIKSDASLLVPSLQLYGEPVPIPQLKPGRDMIRNAADIFPRMQRSDERLAALAASPNAKRTISECMWLMKDMLRAGVELTYERSGRFTRDLYLCYKDFAQYYPEYAERMYQAVNLALNPTTNLKEIVELRDALVPFLQSEVVRLGIAAPPG